MNQAELFLDAGPPGPKVDHAPAVFRGLTTLEELVAALPLEQRSALMYEKEVQVPRLESWHGVRGYAFGGRRYDPKPWPELLLKVRRAVEERVGQKFDSCFCNLYRNGQDTIPWHADDEPWIGPWIASVTFGHYRRFVMKRKRGEPDEHRWHYDLGDGDLLVMHPGTQQAWLHSVPRTTARVGPRLNLTFRQTKGA